MRALRLTTLGLRLLVLSACGGGSGGGGVRSDVHGISKSIWAVGSGLVLTNNSGGNVPVSSNSVVSIASGISAGTTYHVAVATQPANPWQTCTVANGSGTVGASNISNVTVSCVTNTYAVGGQVQGLAGSGLVISEQRWRELACTRAVVNDVYVHVRKKRLALQLRIRCSANQPQSDLRVPSACLWNCWRKRYHGSQCCVHDEFLYRGRHRIRTERSRPRPKPQRWLQLAGLRERRVHLPFDCPERRTVRRFRNCATDGRERVLRCGECCGDS